MPSIHHQFVPPERPDSCDYVIPGESGTCSAPLTHPIHKNHLPPPINNQDRLQKSALQQLNDLQREKTDALGVMLSALPSERQDLRDGRLGNITRYFVQGARARDVAETRLQDEKALHQETQRRLQAEQALNASLREQLRQNAQSGAETDEEEPEVTDVPDAFVRLAMEALDRFAEGYAEYGEGAADALGLAGQWGDLHRKVMKLKKALWEGKPGYLTREGEEEILQDIIGHCLLALEMMDRGFEAGRS